MGAAYTVYWQPGCTSCLRAKELLRGAGIAFESVNVREDPEALARLARLGIRSVPAVVSGDRFVAGQDLDEVARFVGIELERERLPVPVLAARVLALLDAVAALTRSLTPELLQQPLPGRRRTGLDLAYHVPQIVVGLLDAASGGSLTYAHFERRAPAQLRTADDAATVTVGVARHFAAWWSVNAATLPATVDTYYGEQPFHAVLERTAWHVAQHARQLERVLEVHLGPGVAPRLPTALLEALPLPRDVWDAEVPLG